MNGSFRETSVGAIASAAVLGHSLREGPKHPMRLLAREGAEAIPCFYAGPGRLRLLLLPLEQLLPLGDIAVLDFGEVVIERTDVAPGPLSLQLCGDVRHGCLDVGGIDAEVVELVCLVGEHVMGGCDGPDDIDRQFRVVEM